MAYPKYKEIEVPLLKAIEAVGGEAEPQAIYPRVAESFPQLTEPDLTRRLASKPNTPKWWNMVQWTRQKLIDKGEVDGEEFGVWKITDKGRRRLGLETAQLPSEAEERKEAETYDRKRTLSGLFLDEGQFDAMQQALLEKKNLVIQGPPGVGKTFVAKRLAFALIGSNDPRRIEMIQFHQSYSYEDFIQGFRPTPKGRFEIKQGIFQQFCCRAQRQEAHGKPYVFIIDEINRGNLSKILGELMMLIEPDKRGKEHAIPLAYAQDGEDRFYIPKNLYLLGMMNTADRSLAMVDYALRRRFRFISLRPEFASEAFRAFLLEAGASPALVKKIVARMNALNEIIAADTKNLGVGYQIGHSYFCPFNGMKPDEDWYRRVVELEIVPLIEEYWFDNEQKVKQRRAALLD